jgi:hypothetical protein
LPYPPQEQELRQRASEWLSEGDFSIALQAAKDYHEQYPPFGLIGEKTTPPPPPQVKTELSKEEEVLIKGASEGTNKNILEEHREKMILPFRSKLVPPELAREIVNILIINK